MVDYAWVVCDNLLAMWISSLSIKNFRCFGKAELVFREGLNVLVGENNVGKSALFIAISKLFQSTQQNPGEIFVPLDLRYGKLSDGLGPSIECELSLNEQEQEQLVDNLFSERLSLADKADAYKVLRSSVRTPKIVFEWQEALVHTYVKLGPMFVQVNWISSELRGGGTTHAFRDFPKRFITAHYKLTLKEVLAQEQLWQSTGVLQRVGEVLSSRFKIFAEFRARPLSSSRSAALESLQGSETVSVLLNLKSHYTLDQRERYKTICSEFSNFFPLLRIEAVERQPGGQIADVQVIEGSQDYPIPLDNIGAGVAELLTLLTNLVAREGYIFVIEEPESHLHPQAKRWLQELIKNSAKRNQLFVVTHDPYFVEPEDLGALIRLWLTNRGTQTASLPHDLSTKVRAQLATAMKDPTKREVILARAVLWVEDESQKNFILGCANTLHYNLDSSGVSMISVDGTDAFEPYIGLTRVLAIPYLCLRDLPWGSGANRPPEVFRSLGCELEEFLEQVGLSALIKEAKAQVGTSKPRVAQYVGEHIMAEQIPSLFCELIADAVKLSKE